MCAKCYNGSFESLNIGDSVNLLSAYDTAAGGSDGTLTAAGEVTLSAGLDFKWGTDIDLNAGADGLPVFPVFPDKAKFTLDVKDVDLSNFIAASNNGDLTSTSSLIWAWNIGGTINQGPGYFQGFTVDSDVFFNIITGNYEISSWKVRVSHLNSQGGLTTSLYTTLNNSVVEDYIASKWEWEMWFPEDCDFGDPGDNVKFLWKIYQDGVPRFGSSGDVFGNYSHWVLSNGVFSGGPSKETRWCSEPRSMVGMSNTENATAPATYTIGPMLADIGDDSCLP